MPEAQTQNQDGTTAGTTSTGTTTSGLTTAGTSPHQTGQTAGTSPVSTAGGGTSAVAGAGTTEGTQNGSATAGTERTAAEDRSKWHPPHVNKRLSGENQRLKAEVENARRQLAAVTGITPPAWPQTRRLPQGVTEEMVQQARAEFELIHPRLAKLASVPDDVLEELIGWVEKKGWTSVDEIANRDWSRSAASTTRALNAEIKEQLGDISEKTNARIFGAFRAELQSNDEFFQLYEAGDPDLVREFIADYKADFTGFSTRQAASTTTAASGTVARARTLPRGGTTSTVVPGQTEAKPKTEDELHSRAWKRVQDARRNSGTGVAA